MFFSYEFCKRQFAKFTKIKGKERLQLQYIALSGAIASLPTSLVAAPVEHARIRIQIQRSSEGKYNGSFDAAVQIYKKYGLRGLNKGFYATWGRECFGQATYFTVYESVLRASVKRDQRVSEAPLLASLLGGGLAGVSFFLVAYPLDYIKTLFQSD